MGLSMICWGPGTRRLLTSAHVRFWRALFAFTALCNVGVGTVMLVFADPAAALIGVSGAAASYIVGLAGLLIAMFGVAYAVVAWRPLPNRNLVVIGALGKASAVVLASAHAFAGHIPHVVLLLAAGDLPLALAFAVFLAQTRSALGGTP